MSVAIGIPCYRDTDIRCVQAVWDMRKPKGTRLITIGGCYIDRARNLIVHRFLASKCNFLLFLDSDVVPPREGLMKLLKHDLPITSGLYFLRSGDHLPVMLNKGSRDIDTQHGLAFGSKYRFIIDYPENALIAVDAVGWGFLLVKREVFTRLSMPYFKVMTRIKTFLGEDIYFCEKAREAGYRIWVDTSTKCAHIGEQVVTEKEFLRQKASVPRWLHDLSVAAK